MKITAFILTMSWAAQVLGFQITSPAFSDGGAIPTTYQNISPPFEITDAPADTNSFVLISDDPDADGWVHWVVYEIPGDTHQIPENYTGGMSGSNSWWSRGYRGPNPPSGTHHYRFKLYAIKDPLILPLGLSAAELLTLIHGHILAETEITGTYTLAS